MDRAALPKVTCAECGRPMALKDSRFGLFWACTGFPACRGRHGAHKATGLPLGTPTTEAGIEARKRAHAAFDPLWKNGAMTRGEAYRWLAGELGLPSVHIGESDPQRCEQIVRLCLARKFGKRCL